ncbi:sugar transferase [Candidatus Bipolaricaulota bacterium]|nr:sugar transferase [Candidatus Bipolaricaulota bacterium]
MAAVILAVPVWIPLALLIAVIVRLVIGHPVLFRQQRPGWQGRPFTLLKFRTMTDVRDGEGRLLPDADRLTRVGRILRALSLDELPTLVNVLRAEMSLVGPRPLLMQYLARYSGEQARRHEVKPGITGWAQVNGRNALTWEEKFELDVWYVDNVSLWLDLKILWMTLICVLRREGISAGGHVTMPEFMGSAQGE